MDSELRHAIEDFLYLEAELLDERRLREWLELFTDDLLYWMPVRHNPVDRPEDLADELSKPGESYYFNDTKETLRVRVERLYAKTAWSEMPPSRTRHLISNIRVKKDDRGEIESIPILSSIGRGWRKIKIFLSEPERISSGGLTVR